MKLHLTLILLTLLLLPGVSATSITAWDSLGTDDCDFASCGDDEDSVIWRNGRMSFEIVNPSSYVDVVCADMDDDGESDSCIYASSSVLSDCEAAYTDVDDVASDSLFLCSGFSGVCGWGYYQDSVDMGADFLVCNGGEGSCTDVEDAYDSNTLFYEETIQFVEYVDCDDSDGRKEVRDFDNEEVNVVDEKGLICTPPGEAGEVSSKWYVGVNDIVLQNNYLSCSFIEPSYGVEIGYCDDSENYNTSTRDEELNYSLLCKNNFSIIDALIAAESPYVCSDGVIGEYTNETLVDYGGVCGSCTVNVSSPEQDFKWVIARELFIESEGVIKLDNPFNESYCENSEPVAATPVIFLLLLFGGFIGVAVIAIIFFFFLFSFLFSALLTSFFRFSEDRIKKFIKNKK